MHGFSDELDCDIVQPFNAVKQNISWRWFGDVFYAISCPSCNVGEMFISDDVTRYTDIAVFSMTTYCLYTAPLQCNNSRSKPLEVQVCT